MTRRPRIARWSVFALLPALIAPPAHGVDKQESKPSASSGTSSQSVATRYWIANPTRRQRRCEAGSRPPMMPLPVAPVARWQRRPGGW